MLTYVRKELVNRKSFVGKDGQEFLSVLFQSFPNVQHRKVADGQIVRAAFSLVCRSAIACAGEAERWISRGSHHVVC